MKKTAALFLFTLMLNASGAGAALGHPNVDGPDIPPVTTPIATINALVNERYECTESSRTATITVPNVDYDRVIVSVTITPDGDPWDRVFGVSVGGVEVLRGTTPRTAMTVRRDITEYAPLLPRGGTTDVSLYVGSYVGALKGSVTISFYDQEPTAALVRAPATKVRPALRWTRLDGGGQSRSAVVQFGATPPASAVAELTLTGHGAEEFFYESSPVRLFFIAVNGTVVGQVAAMPYLYAFVGFGNENANTPCVGPGTSSFGDTVHPVMWWTAHQGLDIAGVHGGVGEVPSYRVEIDASMLGHLTGTKTVQAIQVNGGSTWITSLAFIER